MKLLKQILCGPVQISRFVSSVNCVGYNLKEVLEERRRMAPKHRDNPVIKKLDTPEFNSIFSNELKYLAGLFETNGYEIRLAGGAVRDLLMGFRPKDLDFATTATPKEMKAMFERNEVRMINMNGEKHGTITPRIMNTESFEVTTLRIDVVTDGRHAEVQYTTDWLLDANRRDLTINSMFLGLDGSVYDYFYGYEDLLKRRIVFVGDASHRIQEDYLRILRYFRFYGRISEKSNEHEASTIDAIKNNVGGLERISGERLWTEFKKILEGNHAGELLEKILECGIGPYLGLPSNYDLEQLRKMYNPPRHLTAISLISFLLKNEEEAMKLHNRLRLSSYDRDLMLFLIENREIKLDPQPLQPYKKLILEGNQKVLRPYTLELLKYINSPHLKELEEWECPKFPISGHVLREKGIESGKFIGHVLNALKLKWFESDFQLSQEELLNDLSHVVAELKEKLKK